MLPSQTPLLFPLPPHQAQRVYVYEALAVVLTAFFLGTAIGLALAIALTVQQNLFTENVSGAR